MLKSIFCLSTFLCVVTLPAFANLTEQDLTAISVIVNKATRPIQTDIARIHGKLESVDKQFESVDKQITHATNVTYGLIALIVVAVGVPPAIIAWRVRKDGASNEQIAALIKAQEKQTAAPTQEIKHSHRKLKHSQEK